MLAAPDCSGQLTPSLSKTSKFATEPHFLSPLFIGERVAESLARVVDIVWGAVTSFLVDEPKLTAQQVHDTLQASPAHGNLEALHAQGVAAELHAKAVAHDVLILSEKSAQQQSDLSLAHTLGTLPTAESSLDHGPVRENRYTRRF